MKIIKIENDKSISRKHAQISIHCLSSSEMEFILVDESKYSRYFIPIRNCLDYYTNYENKNPSKFKFADEGWQKTVSDDKSIRKTFKVVDDFICQILFGVFDSKFTLSGNVLQIANPCTYSPSIFKMFRPIELKSILPIYSDYNNDLWFYTAPTKSSINNTNL